MRSKEIYNDREVATVITLLENGARDHSKGRIVLIINYVFAANMFVFGFLGTGIDFLGAMLEVFPPSPAH